MTGVVPRHSSRSRTAEGSTLVVGTTCPGKAPVIEYRISSYCSGGGCVEVGRTPGGPVVVRDSKDPERRASLVFTAEEWAAFVAGVKDGEFDLA
jgi:Domain of unknown function (DUF397)